MPFHLLKHESLDSGLRRIAKEQITIALENFDNDKMSVSQQVHGLRARCKKMRGLLRLLQPSMCQAIVIEDQKFRDAARAVAVHRDADVHAETIRSLDCSGGVVELPPSSNRSRDIESALAILATCRDSVDDWPLDLHGFADVAAGFSRIYRECQEALELVGIDSNDRNFHKLRKNAKYHWYHVRILEHVNKKELRKRRKRLRKLQLLLGDAHDLAEIQARLESSPDPDMPLLNRTIERKQRYYDKSLEISRRIFAPSAEQMIADLSSWWVERGRQGDMFHSGEMRWFFRGELPPEVRHWFEQHGDGRTEPSRVDDYLVLPHCRTAGIKFRGGRIEFKAQTGTPQATTCENAVSGYRDSWVKWSSKVGDPGYLNELFVREEDRWLSVEKRRHLRLISLGAERPVEVLPGGDLLPRGCQAELTSIRVWPRDEDEERAESWWSLSLESFSDPATVLEDLDRAIEYFFKEAPPSRLELESSMSYPVWLDALALKGFRSGNS